jgi:uncharacterized protein YdaU (DUF1376 family)
MEAGLIYYKRHLGDYAKDTGHLSALEHGIYTLLLDRYYSTERPIPEADAEKVGRVRTAQERAALQSVLDEYFKPHDGLWHHSYADKVIDKAHMKAGTSRANGKLGGRPPNVSRGTKATDKPKGNPEETRQVPGNNQALSIHHPLSINQKEKTFGGKPPYPPEFEECFAAYPRRNGDNPKRAALRAWSARRADGHELAPLLNGVRRYAAWCEATDKIGTETVMQAKRFFGPDAPFLNGWESPAKTATNGHSAAAWAEVRAANQAGPKPAAWTYPQTEAAIAAIGGWSWLKTANSRDIDFKQRQFEAAFRGAA